MSEHCGQVTHHVRKSSYPQWRRCDWCGQWINEGERYAKWLYYDAGKRSTMYAHDECAEVWMEAASDEGGIVYARGDCDRPNASMSVPNGQEDK